MTPKCVTLSERSALTFETYLNILYHKVNISSENNDFSFNSCQKSNLISLHLNALRNNFDLDVKYDQIKLGSLFI